MKVALLYDNQKEEDVKKVEKIKQVAKNTNIKYEFEYLTSQIQSDLVDLYVIFSNEISTISMYVKKIEKCDMKKVIILTSKAEVGHVLACVDITEHVVFSKKSEIDILNNFEKVANKFKKGKQNKII